jgi:putative spermidine/putrescine transport system substrate-binding protein
LPEDVKAKLLPAEQYKSARAVEDHAAWDQTALELPQLWQQEVLIHAQ